MILSLLSNHRLVISKLLLLSAIVLIRRDSNVRHLCWCTMHFLFFVCYDLMDLAHWVAALKLCGVSKELQALPREMNALSSRTLISNPTRINGNLSSEKKKFLKELGPYGLRTHTKYLSHEKLAKFFPKQRKLAKCD